MLTLDLLRLKVDGDTVSPIFLTVKGGCKYPPIARLLLELFRDHVGKRVGEFDQALDELIGSAADYKVMRGLAKILTDTLETVPPSDAPAEELRRTVFTLAAAARPLARQPDMLIPRTVDDALTDIAGTLRMTPAQVRAGLYADLKDRQVISGFDDTLTPEGVLERYNTALAQAMLYRATRLVVDVFDSYRLVFKYLKLAQLMHTITPLERGYRIDIDGPLSLFAHTERYGIGMAKFLPAILRCQEWRMYAKVNVWDAEKIFRLSPRAGLVSHYREEPIFNSAYEEAFYTRFVRNTKSKWTIAREGALLHCRDIVMIPDFTFTHQDGRVAHLEIIGFWTPQYLQRKLAKLAALPQANIVIALPAQLNCAQDDFAGAVLNFKQRLLLKDVLPALEAVATLPGEATEKTGDFSPTPA